MVDGESREGPGVGAREGESTFALCTELEVHPWVQIDLGTQRRVDLARVFGRADCCWGDNDLPLSLQLSADGNTFETIAVRNEPFSSEDPWRVAVGGRVARFVRLYGETSERKNMVLSEVEVIGR